jgi:hypothetical protein
MQKEQFQPEAYHQGSAIPNWVPQVSARSVLYSIVYHYDQLLLWRTAGVSIQHRHLALRMSTLVHIYIVSIKELAGLFTLEYRTTVY